PEGLFKSIPEFLGIALKLVGAVNEAAGGGDLGRQALCGVDVALHLAERDRAFRVAAVGVEYGIAGVLPPLVCQPGFAALIFDTSVAVPIAVSVDPMQRSLDVRPQLRNGGEVTGALEIQASEHDEERRAVDRAVVTGERNLAEARHFP